MDELISAGSWTMCEKGLILTLRFELVLVPVSWVHVVLIFKSKMLQVILFSVLNMLKRQNALFVCINKPSLNFAVQGSL